MIPQGLLTQIGMIIVAVGIALTYVKPMFEEVTGVQDKIAVYREEQQKVSDVNDKLSQHLARANQLSTADRDRLYTYMPNDVDGIAVQRDLLFIADQAGIELSALSQGVSSDQSGATVQDGEGAGGRSTLTKEEFTLGFVASYEKIKGFLSLLEQNNYPLTVTSLTIAPNNGKGTQEGGVTVDPGQLTASVKIATYKLTVGDKVE